jgi:prepilin-type N-terminal cleavage/methylation domain-containing protein
MRSVAWERCARPRGFSLLELCAVLVIVGVLVTFSVAAYRREILRAKAAATIQELTQIRLALIRFEADCGGLPPWSKRGGDPGLCYAPAYASGTWGGPYLDRWSGTTPLGGVVVYQARGGPSDVAPASLSVDGLSSDETGVLSPMLDQTFGTDLGSTTRVGTRVIRRRARVLPPTGRPGTVLDPAAPAAPAPASAP